MFETKVEWEACVGESSLQFSIFSNLCAVTGTRRFASLCVIQTYSCTVRAQKCAFFFAGRVKTCIVEVP